MWVTKLLIFPVEIRIFCPKTTKFGPKLAFLVNLGQAMQAYSMPCCGSVGGCGARAVSRKTPIFILTKVNISVIMTVIINVVLLKLIILFIIVVIIVNAIMTIRGRDSIYIF